MADAEFDFSQFTQGLQSLPPAVIEAALDGVNQFGEQLIGNAQELTPVETGALQASGTATDAKVDGDSIEKVVGFNTDYAAARHENPPEADAPPKINPKGRWKFLSTAMDQLGPKFEGFIGRFVKRALKDE